MSDSSRVRVLLIEDDDTDAELVSLALNRSGLPTVVHRAVTKDDVIGAFSKRQFDVVVCDYQLRGMTATDILALYREAELDAPLIVCSGAVPEEAAVSLLKAGAADFFRKESVARLGAAIRRELQEAATRQAHLRAERELSESEERFRRVVEASPNGLVLIDANGRMVLVNGEAERMFGYSRDELLQQDVEILVPESAHARHLEWREAYARRPRPRKMGVGSQLYGKRRNGESFPVEIGLTPFETSNAPMVLATIVDVTQRLAMEQQLRQVHKMEAIGRLAGGIAHDFNNILTAIRGFGELAKGELPPAHPVQDSLDEILRAAVRASELTRQMLAFSRKQVLRPRAIALNAVIEDCSRMLRRITREDVDLVLRLDPALETVLADPVQMEQVLLNLVANARDAMPGGGRVVIETANVTLDEDYVRDHPAGRAGRFAMIAVSDTGMGMDEATQAHVFEPFFTTKPSGHGTGLGLATVYGIVKQSEGFVWVYSEAGHGTTLKIYLPAVDVPAESLNEGEASRLPARGVGSILLVEDQDAVRKAVSQQLEKQGYRVLTAEDGESALRLPEAEVGAIDLLLTDVLMPGMNGPELAKRLRSARPGLRVLLMSGYSSGEVTNRHLQEQGFELVEKPFSTNVLLSAVQKALAADS